MKMISATMETAPEEKTRTVYVLLMRSSTIFSRIICVFTKAPYTHSSIGIKSDSDEFFSFGRRYAYLPFPAGFTKEKLSKGVMGKNPFAPCALYRVTVEKEAYDQLRRRLMEMLYRKSCYKYSLAGAFACFFNRPMERPNKYFCSQFVAYALNSLGAIEPKKPLGLYRPADFTYQPELELCYIGTLRGLARRLSEGETFCAN